MRSTRDHTDQQDQYFASLRSGAQRIPGHTSETSLAVPPPDNPHGGDSYRSQQARPSGGQNRDQHSNERGTCRPAWPDPLEEARLAALGASIGQKGTEANRKRTRQRPRGHQVEEAVRARKQTRQRGGPKAEVEDNGNHPVGTDGVVAHDLQRPSTRPP